MCRTVKNLLSKPSTTAVSLQRQVCAFSSSLPLSFCCHFQPPRSSFPHGAVPDVDDAGIIGTRVCTERKDGHPSVSQLARKALLAQMQGAKEQAIPIEAGLCCADRCSGAYHEVNQGLGHLKPADKEPAAVKGSEPSKSGSTHSHLRFTPVGRLEQAERKQAGEQYLLFRRLYSDLERVQVRQRQLRKSHCERVQRLKREKEADRRVAEDEVNPMESFTSTVSSEAAEEGQKAVEWAEMVALEERRHQLQRLKESERYIDALRERLRGRLTQQQATVPPLCSCGSSVWDAGPDTCANNCVFYKNPRGRYMGHLSVTHVSCFHLTCFPISNPAYARTLSNLLASLDK